MKYTPSKHIVLNKPIAIAGDKPESARMVLYNENTFTYRSFISVDEVNSYFPEDIRKSWITVLVNDTGTLDESTNIITGGLDVEYWYQDNKTLTRKTPDLSLYAKTTDIEKNLKDSKDYTDQKINEIPSVDLSSKEDISNKSNDISLGESESSDVLYPTQKATKTYIDSNVKDSYISIDDVSDDENYILNFKRHSGENPTEIKINKTTNSKINIWNAPFIFTAEKETGTVFSLIHKPINILSSFLNSYPLNPISDIQIDNEKMELTLNTKLMVGQEYTLLLNYTY